MVINADNTITYTPDAGYIGTDSFTYDVSDGGTPELTDTATVSITIYDTNTDPVANDDMATTSLDTSITIDVLANDTDAENDTLIVTAASALHGTIVVNGNGTLGYTPDTDFGGDDTISYSISDGHGGSDSAVVQMTVTAPGDGSDRDDILSGTPRDDVIYGLAGNDVIDGLDGNDLIKAGDGDDRAEGGNGDDVIYDGAGDDSVFGEGGNDRLVDGAGDDYLNGGPRLRHGRLFAAQYRCQRRSGRA